MDRSTIASHCFASLCLQAIGMVSNGTSMAERARSHMEQGLATSGKAVQLSDRLQHDLQDWACLSPYVAHKRGLRGAAKSITCSSPVPRECYEG